MSEVVIKHVPCGVCFKGLLYVVWSLLNKLYADRCVEMLDIFVCSLLYVCDKVLCACLRSGTVRY